MSSFDSFAVLMKGFLIFVLLGLVGLLSAKEPLTLISYNIRYDNRGDQGVRSWEQRRGKVVKYLLEKKADFVALQEVREKQLHELDEALACYNYIGVGRDAHRGGEHSPLFYDPKKWKIDAAEQGTFWLSDTPTNPGSQSWGNEIPRICSWARFVNPSGNGLYVFNTHWDHQSQESRIKASELILQRIKARKNQQEPYVLMGDLNASRTNLAVQMLLRSDVLVDHGGEEFKTFNRWQGALVPGPRIDHIFTSPRFFNGKFEPDANGNPPASDHHPVVLRIRMK